MNRNTRNALAVTGVVLAVFGGWVLYLLFSQPSPAAAQTPAPVVPQPITQVSCGKTYQLEHTELYYPDESKRVARNFSFGGEDRGRLPQYIWVKNVIGLSTEQSREVDRSLAYGEVTFLCLEDPSLEGHKISNIKIMQYSLRLRRPLRPQTVIRNGGLARQ